MGPSLHTCAHASACRPSAGLVRLQRAAAGRSWLAASRQSPWSRLGARTAEGPPPSRRPRGASRPPRRRAAARAASGGALRVGGAAPAARGPGGAWLSPRPHSVDTRVPASPDAACPASGPAGAPRRLRPRPPAPGASAPGERERCRAGVNTSAHSRLPTLAAAQPPPSGGRMSCDAVVAALNATVASLEAQLEAQPPAAPNPCLTPPVPYSADFHVAAVFVILACSTFGLCASLAGKYGAQRGGRPGPPHPPHSPVGPARHAPSRPPDPRAAASVPGRPRPAARARRSPAPRGHFPSPPSASCTDHPLSHPAAWLRMPGYALCVGKTIGTGILLACALVHLLQPAAQALTSACVPYEFNTDYQAYAFLYCSACVAARRRGDSERGVGLHRQPAGVWLTLTTPPLCPFSPLPFLCSARVSVHAGAHQPADARAGGAVCGLRRRCGSALARPLRQRRRRRTGSRQPRRLGRARQAGGSSGGSGGGGGGRLDCG